MQPIASTDPSETLSTTFSCSNDTLTSSISNSTLDDSLGYDDITSDIAESPRKTRLINEKDIYDTLLNVGYNDTEIKSTISKFCSAEELHPNFDHNPNAYHNPDITPAPPSDPKMTPQSLTTVLNQTANGQKKNRPKTNVFSQGKVFTYDKLDIPSTSSGIRSRKKNPVISSCLDDNLELNETVPSPPSTSNVNSAPQVEQNATKILRDIRVNNLHNVVVAQLNINSLRNKFQSLVEITHGNIDVLILTETKLDHTFPENQFVIPGYKKPYRLDRNKDGGGVMIYVREDIPSDILLKHKLPKNIEAIFIEINLRKNRILLIGTYHSTHKTYGTDDETFFNNIGLALDVYSSFDKFLLAGDFNIQEENDILDEFMEDYLAKNLVKEPTCFKNVDNPSCIDLFITNSYRSFQKTTTVTTGLSDFHKMTLTVMKTTFPKTTPRVISYRTPYQRMDLENALKKNLASMTSKTYEEFETAVVKSHNEVSFVKHRTVRANDKPHVTKEMRQAIMLRSQLQSRKFKYGTEEDIKAFNRQKNFCNRLAKRTRKNHYNQLNIKDITDNTKFWDTVKPFFSDKSAIREKIMLRENDEIISDSKQVAEIFANYFQKSGSAESLGITENKLLLTQVPENTVLDVEKCVRKFESHPSIISIKKNVEVTCLFDFSPITAEDIDKQIGSLDPKKNGGCIPTKLLIEMRHMVSQPLADVWNNELLKDKIFSSKLKLGDISAVFKALEKTTKTNYRPITVLVVVSKVFEKIMDQQTNSYIEKFLSKYLCGYRKNFNCETALVPMIEKWKMARDKGENAGGVLMDLSKAFDTINHELLVAKLHAYGFSIDALKIVHSYLSERWIRTKVDGSFSTWKEILSGMPQGSVNGPKWFNIYLNDLFFLFINTEVCNIADDSTPYACNADLSILLHHLESDVASAIMWFDANYMKLNQSKCHFLISSNSPEHLWIQVGEQIIWESLYEKLLGVTINKDLKFNDHVQSICKKAGAKVTALARLIRIVTMEQKKILMNSFIESQFSYCPLVWMFCPSRKMNRRINHLHERALRIVYNDFDSSFQDLLLKNGTVSVHHRNIQLVAILMFKVKNDLCPEIMKDIFHLNSNSNIDKTFFIPRVKTEFMGKLSLRYFGPVVWETMLPNEYKEITNLEKFKDSIKKWIPQCKCRLCKPFVAGVGFM